MEIGRLLLETCAPALRAITEPASSQGIFVRPRRGRLEYGGEYVEGSDLIAALTLLTGCVAGLLADTKPAQLGTPPWVPSREKFGWFLPPPSTAGPEHLAVVWSWARPHALRSGLPPEPVDALAEGRLAVRAQRPEPADSCSFSSPGAAPEPATRTHPRELADGTRAATEWLTWQHAVWLFRAPDGRECRIVVDADDEPELPGPARRGSDGSGDPSDDAARATAASPARPRRPPTASSLERRTAGCAGAGRAIG